MQNNQSLIEKLEAECFYLTDDTKSPSESYCAVRLQDAVDIIRRYSADPALVERVAKALRKAASHEPDDTYEFYEGNGETCSPESLAKAAIEAMLGKE